MEGHQKNPLNEWNHFLSTIRKLQISVVVASLWIRRSTDIAKYICSIQHVNGILFVPKKLTP